MNEVLNFEFKGKVYTIEYPNIGKYRKIDILKQSLSMGQYGNLFRTMTKQSEESLDMIDIEAYMTILCPKLFKDLGIQSFDELNFITYKTLKKSYKEQFIPWWNSIEEMLIPESLNKEKDEEERAG
ncbi:MAG: hypothetical protein M0R03_17385 [Novosphingobium sp.]|nr:hypothetical protein [Novosphingobium sp.]